MRKLLLMLLLSLPLSVLAQATDHLSEVTVNVETPGTLVDLILQQTADLTDVVTLHLGGTINDDDIQTLQKQLKRLRHLDALNLQMPEVPQRFLYNCDTLRTVILPAVATIISKNAFDSCDSLKSVTLPEGLTTIGDYAFRSCSKLQDIPFPSTLKSIGEYAFHYCTALQAVQLPSTLKTIGKSAFESNSSLTEINFPEGLNSIDAYAFSYCKSLTKAILPESLQSMGKKAFSDCSSLREVCIPAGLKVIPEGAFYYTCGLESLAIPEGITEIGSSAFYRAFWYDKNRSGDKPIRLTMPSTLKRIESSAFASNNNIVELTLNDGLEYMGYNCFESAGIKEVTIPNTVKHAISIFYNCDSLTRITCLPLIPPANYDGYNFITGSYNTDQEVKGCTLVVPAASIKEYKQTLGYDHYAAYEAIDYMPTDIIILRPFRLTVPANVPQLNITMQCNKEASTKTSFDMGTLRLEGNNSLNVGNLSMFYDFITSDWSTKYGRSTDVYDPYGTNPDEYYYCYKNGFTSIIADAPWTVGQVEQTIIIPSARWYFFCPPYDVKVGDIQIMNEFGGQFVVREYDSQQRAASTGNTWRQLTADNTLQAGHSYIIQGVGYNTSNGNYYDLTLRLPLKANGSKGTLCATTDIAIPVTDYPSASSNNRGWNLIGNPYPCYVNGAYVDFTAPITIWNPTANRYEAIRLTDDKYVFSPMEAFFVQYSTETPKMVFHKEGRQTSFAVEKGPLQAPRHAALSGRKVFNVLLNNGDDHDRTRFVINPEAHMDYEADKDAAYMPSLSDEVSSLYTRQGNIQYAINERPVGDGLINLGMRLVANGTYTLSLNTNETDEVLLIDRQANTTIPLTAEGYTFTAEAGTIEGRFAIQLSGMTGIKNENVNKNDNAIYDLQGRRIECSMFNVQCSMLKKGIYIIGGKKHVVK